MAEGKAAERICDELRDMIADGRLTGGTRVTETELAHALRVSRTPVREALAQLQGEGLVSYPKLKRLGLPSSLSEEWGQGFSGH